MILEIELLNPILKGGIHNTNFFNGRVLSAEDLKVEQDANRIHHLRLGRAAGEGVVYGLEVSAEIGSSSLSITQGLSLNRRGESLCLPEDVSVDFIPASGTYAQGETFFECNTETETIPTGKGVYILVISHASGLKETAPMSGLFARGTIPGCGSKYAVEGVQFRLVKLDIDINQGIRGTTREKLKHLMDMTDAASTSKLRNILAHLCFGTDDVSDFVRAPFNVNSGSKPARSSFATYGVLDTLRSMEMLTDHDVPLAMVYWSTEMIKFVDMWSVRRKLTERSNTDSWNLFTGSRRMAEVEAVFLQFQGQIEQIIQSTENRESIEAAKYFSYLPATGMIPISGDYLNTYMDKIGGKPPGVVAEGFDPEKFFNTLTTRESVFIEGPGLEALMRDSLSYPPIDLARKEMMWVYLVRENVISMEQPYVIFTSGHVPYRGDARYDLTRWGYGFYE